MSGRAARGPSSDPHPAAAPAPWPPVPARRDAPPGPAANAAAPAPGTLLADALAGLAASPRTLPCKWLYDPAGAALFECITRLPEYYPTRTEIGILRARAAAIAAGTGPGAVVVELGSGSAEKVGPLLDALERPAAYVPVDIAPEWLEGAAARLAAAYPALAVRPLVADFTGPFALPDGLPDGPRLGFFPGSTIGNFEPGAAASLLARARAALGPGGAFVVGADLVKDAAVLEAAYDDAEGVTAAFDRNLLARLNAEAGADFDLARFRHRAVWNPALARVEMHLEALGAQRVRLGGRSFAFADGETIHTESSHKYTPDSFAALARAGGWRPARHWTDPAGLFSVWRLEAD